MKKTIFLFVALLVVSAAQAKYIKAILYMNDGSQKKGLAEMVESDDSKVKFKVDENAKSEKFSSSAVKKIEFTDNDEIIYTAESLYAITANIFTGKFSKSKKKLWFYIIYNKDVKIGCIGSNGTFRSNASGTSTINISPSTTYFFGKKNSDALVFGYFTSTNTIGAIGTDSLLRKMSREAFVDCPKLIEAIEKENFKLKTLIPTIISIFDKIKCK
ncbi:hypothetical protein HNQ02_000802 [Flavobacterium sp. 7E]|uniref:hypothetical protein n=1 Tax=Flavobacterium sp. 7E TaxID=2735898 RepID=UPI0015703216|nr:hypothetical protein [Flavobacterium sp. 7E]NRS87892.1 hypothetical protein [Flavobacterium sp. 7E]